VAQEGEQPVLPDLPLRHAPHLPGRLLLVVNVVAMQALSVKYAWRAWGLTSRSRSSSTPFSGGIRSLSRPAAPGSSTSSGRAGRRVSASNDVEDHTDAGDASL